MGSFPIAIQSILAAPGVADKNLTFLKKRELLERMESIISKRSEDSKEAFYVLDFNVLTNLYDTWRSSLPTIQPFYAVKCNPEKAFLSALAALGSNFDCASKGEIEEVLSLGVSPNRIIYANPCKEESHIKFAKSVGVNLTTFDSREELDKIKKWHPKCSLLIRINVTDDGKAIMPMSSKFGCLPMEVRPLLQAAKTMQLNVIGVSFHVGSAVLDPCTYNETIEAAKTVFEAASQLGLPKMRLLDIGGGFVAGPIFEQVATTVKAALQAYFPNEPGLTVIAEPGRFFAETAFTLAANIIHKRVRGDVREYWINDGVFGSFLCVPLNGLSAPIKCMPLACNSNCMNVTCQGLKTYSSTVYGQTLDSIDMVLRGYQLPELEVNDWLVFPKMGAYTISCGSNFNSFSTPLVWTYLLSSD